MKQKYNYPSSIIQTINSVIKECAASPGLYPTQSNPSHYLTQFFCYSQNYYIPDNAFQCIWYNLIQFQQLGKSNWIKSYWEFAVSYANLHLSGMTNHYDSDGPRLQLLHRFQQLHHVYCGYLLYANKFQLLNHLRNFSNSQPYRNCLVPYSLDEICLQLVSLNPSYNPLYMDTFYDFYQINGVKNGDIAWGWTVRYYCICCIAQPDIFFQLNYFRYSLTEEYQILQELDTLVRFIETDRILSVILKDQKFLNVSDIDENQIIDTKNRLNEIREELNHKISRDKQDQEKSKDREEDFKNTVNELVKNDFAKYHLPVNYEKELNDASELRLLDNKIEKNYFTEEQLLSYIGIPEAFASLAIRSVNLMFARQLKSNSPRKRYNIDFYEVQEALNKLDLNEDFCIITLGIELDPSLKTPVLLQNIHHINTSYSEILIMPKQDCPALILSNVPINLEITDGMESEEVTIHTSIPYIYEQKKFIHYVLLNVVFQDYQGIPSQLKDIKPIKDLLT